MSKFTICPTAIAARDLTLAECGGGAEFGHRAMGRSQFVRAVHQSVYPLHRWLSEGESLAVTAGVIGRHYAQNPAAPFYGLRHRAGFWSSLHQFLNECRAAVFKPGELAGVLKGGGVDELRADFLSRLFDAQTEKMAALSASNASFADAKLAETLRDGIEKMDFLRGVSQIEIRGIYDMTPASFEWILELSRHIPTTVFLPLPVDHPLSVSWLVWTYRKFESLGEHEPDGFSVQPEDLESGRAVSELLPRVFESLARLKQNNTPLLSERVPVRILEPADPKQEIVEIARIVRKKIDGGADPSRIAVLFRKPENYPTAADAFGSFGIPIEVSPDLQSRWSMRLAAREILDAATLAAEGFERDAIIGWAGRTHAELPPVLHHPDFGWILREARVTKGTPGEIAAQIERYARDGRDKNMRALAADAGRELAKQLEHIKGLSRAAAPSHFLATLEESLDLMGFFSGNVEDAGTIRQDIHRLRRILSDWTEPLEPAVLLDLLELSLDLDAPADPARAGVRLLSVQDVAGIEIDHLVIAGMVAGAFPREPKQEVFLKDRERREVSAAFAQAHKEILGPRLAGRRPFDTAKEERLRENFLFFLCLAQARQDVTLSWPKTDTQGRPAIPSPFIEEVFKHFSAPEKLIVRGGVDAGPKNAEEIEREAVAQLASGAKAITASDPDRISWLAKRADVERNREKFYLERHRQNRNALAFEFTGRLTGPGVYWPKEEMSLRALESFAGCPFKGFAGEILRVRKTDDPVDGISARDQGILLHKFLEMIWKELKQRFDQKIKNTSDVMAAAAEMSERVLDSAVKESAPAILDSPLWPSQRTAILVLIGRILDVEERGLGEGFWPELVEHEFHLDIPGRRGGDLPQTIRGRLDRLDKSKEGAIRILDFKLTDTGSLRDKKKMMCVTEWQLPAYGLSAAAKDETLVELFYVSLKHAAARIEFWSGTQGGLRKLFRLDPVLESVKRGRFDVTPVDADLCDRCEFRRSCRIKDVLSRENTFEGDST